MTILFREDQSPRFTAKDERWWVCEDREVLEIHDPDRIDDYQDRWQRDRNRNNLILKGHY